MKKQRSGEKKRIQQSRAMGQIQRACDDVMLVVKIWEREENDNKT